MRQNVTYTFKVFRRSQTARCRQPQRKGETMSDIYNHAMRWVNSIDSQDWLMVLVAAVVLGFLMLRGFGSRSNY
jgi:hypothetical protein